MASPRPPNTPYIADSAEMIASARGGLCEPTASRKMWPGYCDEDADVELVSSDGVSFQVHSWLLKGYSNLLREALESPVIGTSPSQVHERHTIAFADREFENSRTLACVLDLFTGKNGAPPISAPGDCHRIQKGFQFLRKWECGTTVRFLISHVSHMVHVTDVIPDNPGRLLLGAIVLEDIDFVCTILTRTGWIAMPAEVDQHELPDLRATPSQSYLDPVHMPYEHRAALPQAYRDALSRAISETFGCDTGSYWNTMHSWTEVADRFRRHLPEIQAAGMCPA